MGSNRVRRQQREEQKQSRRTTGHDASNAKDKYKEQREEFVRANKITPMNKKQASYLHALQDPDISVIVATGHAGTSKTFIPTAFSCLEYLQNRVYKIAFSRPAISNSKSLGFFAGPQPLWTKVLTDTGYRLLSEVQENDLVYTPEGNLIRVKSTQFFKNQNVYKIETNSGQVTYSSENHLWKVKSLNDRKHNKDYQLLTLKQILEKPLKNNKLLEWSLPKTESISFNKNLLSIPPYLLGAFLGDGCFSNSLSFYNIDKDCIDKFNKDLETLNCSLVQCTNTQYTIRDNLNKTKKSSFYFIQVGNKLNKFKSKKDVLNFLNIDANKLDSIVKNFEEWFSYNGYYIRKEPNRDKYNHVLKNLLSSFNLSELKAWEKFIPKDYLYSSKEQRLELLRGLLDTDGWCDINGKIGFSTTSKQLSKDVAELVRSLGGRVTIVSRDRINQNNNGIITKRLSYQLSISLNIKEDLFYIKRKEENRNLESKSQNNFIKHIDFYSIEDCKCLTLDNEDGMYITDDYIPTHNSKDEKMSIWLAPVLSTVKQYLNSGVTEIAIKKEDIIFYPLEIIKGLSLGSTVEGRRMFFIVDEAEDLTIDEVKKIITRVGKNCTLVLAGDITQSELKENSGLKWLINFYEKYDLKGFYHVDFNDVNDIVRSDTVKSFITALQRETKTKKEETNNNGTNSKTNS